MRNGKGQRDTAKWTHAHITPMHPKHPVRFGTDNSILFWITTLVLFCCCFWSSPLSSLLPFSPALSLLPLWTVPCSLSMHVRITKCTFDATKYLRANSTPSSLSYPPTALLPYRLMPHRSTLLNYGHLLHHHQRKPQAQLQSTQSLGLHN